MKKILSIFKQGWFISLLGAAALALLIWFIGPLFAFAGHSPLISEPVRWFVIGIILLIWLIYQTGKYIQAKRTNTQVVAGIVASQTTRPSAEDQASQEEIQTLQERLSEALEVLKNSPLGGRTVGHQLLYQLPWYMLIGPPGSGKTTLLSNSGMTFPLAGQFGKKAIQGIGGTRNCDWWFTDDAVLLDTAGRYTTQDSHAEVDRSAWLGFLGLLKKHRRRRPLNGAIITISVADLLTLDETQRLTHAQAIRNRVEELYQQLNVCFPVYLLFTKCDLLAGFIEYFDDLDREGRAQIWGATFPLDPDAKTDSLEQLEEELTLLEQRLQGSLIEKIERERSSERRGLIYRFPQQFSALRPLVIQFTHEVFQQTRFKQPVMLRGIYFTSATQEGSPIDRIMDSLISRFGLDRHSLTGTSGSGKSFFITKLLKQLVIAESGLAGTNLKQEAKRARIQRGAFASTLIVSILAAALWSYSFIDNLAYIKTTSARTAELHLLTESLQPRGNRPQQPNSLMVVLPLLNEARHLPAGYADQQKGNLRAPTLGLSQADKLGSAATAAYLRLLKDGFLPLLMDRLEQQIRTSAHNTERLYEALKVYLMLGDGTHYHAESIRAWISLDWDNRLTSGVTREQRQALDNHLSALLETRPAPLPRPLNKALIDQTRDLLARAPLAERVYSRLKTALSQARLPEFTVSQAAGRTAPQVFIRHSGKTLSSGVPGLFTYEGYHDYFLPANKQLSTELAGESWILGDSQQMTANSEQLKLLQDDVHKRYLDEYAMQWHALLADIRIVPFRGLEEAVQVLNILSSKESPLLQLLHAILQETALDRVDESEKRLTDKAQEQLESAKSRLQAILGQRTTNASDAETQIGPQIVSQQFKDLHELVDSQGEQSPVINQIIAMLNELYIYLSPLIHASGDDIALEQRQQITNMLQKVQIEAKRQPRLVNDLLTNSTQTVSNIVAGGICQHLNAMWKSDVLTFYNKAINRRYPISPDSRREITQEDFGQFFGPNGIMEQFFNTYLASSVDRSGSNWRWISRDQSPACVSGTALQQFKRAEIIRNTFFRSAAQIPTVNFRLKPLSMSGDISRLNLDIDGQPLSYAHEQPQVTLISWPGPNNAGVVSLQLSPTIQGKLSGTNIEGPWALFRLFDDAKVRQIGNSEQFVVAFDLQGRTFSFELRAASAYNPFQLSELLDFRCPPRL